MIGAVAGVRSAPSLAPAGLACQHASRYTFEQTVGGQRRWNGLCYLSKHGDDLTNWAVFEPATPDVIDVAEFDRDDPDLLAALATHHLELQ